MKSKQWHKTYQSWKEYRKEVPAEYEQTKKLCGMLNDGIRCIAWPDCYRWMMWAIKYGTDPRLIDGAVNYILNNQNKPNMTFYKCQNKYAYMTKILTDETNQIAVDEGRWQDVKMYSGPRVLSINSVVNATLIMAENEMLKNEIKRLTENNKKG